MTDEEFGRAWATQNGVTVNKDITVLGGYWIVGQAQAIIFEMGHVRHATEARAFAALADAVKEIQRQVPPLRAPTKCVITGGLGLMGVARVFLWIIAIVLVYQAWHTR